MTDLQIDQSRRKLQKDSLSSQIARSLREDIYFGRLKPGTHLAQQQLCEEFGISRMPVRDALRELVYAGLLIQDDARHTVVAPLRRSDLLDNFEIEGLLNGMAVRRAIENMSEGDIASLKELNKQMNKACADGDQKSMAALNWQFHRSINRLAKSPKLLTALRGISLDVPRDFLVQVPSWMEKSDHEHNELIAAIERRDADAAEALMVSHLVDSGEGLVEYLKSNGLDLE